MNIYSSTIKFNETPSQSKAVSFITLLLNAASKLRKSRKSTNKKFWNYTKINADADITSYKGLL